MVCFRCGAEIREERETHYGLHAACFRESFHAEELLEFGGIARLAADSSESDGARSGQDVVSSFFQGKFRKYGARLGGIPYILKVEEQGYPELPAVEHLCNQIASALDLDVPDFQLIRFHGSTALAVRNFIRPGRREALHHIYHFLEGAPFDCGTLVRILGDRTGRLAEIERFVRLCLFDALIGNHDRHGRNLALIEEGGQYRLSPFYDNPSYIGVEEVAFLPADHSPRGRIATSESDEPEMWDYAREFERLGYGGEVERFRRDVETCAMRDLVGWRFLSEARAEALGRLILKRKEQLGHVE